MVNLQKLADEAPALPVNSEEYRRLEYSLKMNLRLINGRFSDLQIHRVNGVNLQDRTERTQIETMELVTLENNQKLEDMIMAKGRVNIPKNSPKVFTFGTIIDKADDLIRAQTQGSRYMICVFRIGVGKSSVHKFDPSEELSSIRFEENFDSVFLEDLTAKPLFQMKYLINNPELVTLTHLIRCGIEVDELHANIGIQDCHLCGANAENYREEDQAYFCDECNELVHPSDGEEISDHDRKLKEHLKGLLQTQIQDSPKIATKFGFCKNHPKRQNEYWDRQKNAAYCALCAMDIAQGKRDGSNQSSLIDLESAYNNARSRADDPDAALSEKEKILKIQMEQISSKIQQIKQQAAAAKEKITQMVEKALRDLYDVVKQKTQILKADRLELARQSKEISFMKDYLLVQMDGTPPLEFLKLSQGHDLLTLQVCKHHTLLSEIEIEIQVSPQLQIKSDQTIRDRSIDDSKNQKQQTLTKVQNTILDKKTFSGYRSRIFGDKDLGANGPGRFGGLASKNPSASRILNLQDMPYANAVEKANIIAYRDKQGLGPPLKIKENVNQQIEKMFDLIEEKTKNIAQNAIQHQRNLNGQATSSIVQESIERSVFGKFTQNYKKYKNRKGEKENVEIWKNFFSPSDILGNVERCLLYFNLPYDEIIFEEFKPTCLFSWDKNLQQNSKGQGGHDYIVDMLNEFEKQKSDKTRLANVILLKVPNTNTENATKDDFQIIGGYASDGWAASEKRGGDDTCFLFNLSQNLRFNAVPNKSQISKNYQQIDTQSDIRNNQRRILFGQVALVIEQSFKKVTSSIESNDIDAMFAFGNDQVQKHKVDCIIPGKRGENLEPHAVEVWNFELKHQDLK